MRAKTKLLLILLTVPGLAQAVDCTAVRAQQPLRSTVIAPVTSELAMVTSQLGTPEGVLSQAFDESQSLDQVLLRMHTESCSNLATITPAPGVVNPDDPAAYKPRTEFDNAPWRFNMNQNGKNMTADEFSAWMKSRGVRVARGATAAPLGGTTDSAGDATSTPPPTEAPAVQTAKP